MLEKGSSGFVRHAMDVVYVFFFVLSKIFCKNSSFKLSLETQPACVSEMFFNFA